MLQLWPPVHASHVGARHQARGNGCQDTSLSLQGQLACGTPYSLLLVADGHGDPRHARSATGSRLACDVSAELVERAAGDPHTDWSSWLNDPFAEQLTALWGERCRDDHRQLGPEAGAFSLELYGTTLGLVLLTPDWWGCTGIGDWMLALISTDQAQVISAEPPQPGAGEATYSLCMANPLPLMAERYQWHELRERPEPALALVLTTDGVHISCLSERDHLVLCHYLAKAGLPPEQRDDAVDLQAALAQITREGVGDDVSVAVGALGNLRLSGQLER